jgi:hypothetical protein
MMDMLKTLKILEIFKTLQLSGILEEIQMIICYISVRYKQVRC